MLFESHHITKYLSHLVGKPTMWFPNRSYTNQAAQSQKQAKSLNFRIEEEEEVYYPCSENVTQLIKVIIVLISIV